MALVIDNLILETVSVAVAASDQIPLTLGALPGYRTFAAKCAVGDTVHYLIRAVDVAGRPTGDWENGRGTIMEAAGVRSIRRDLVFGSSNADAAVTFAAGLKFVSLPPMAPATRDVREDLQAALGLDFVGMVGLFPINVLRPGWIKANGAAVSRVTYARLFAHYGTTYGVGNGATTFNLPDYRGEFMRFFDDSRGLDSARVLTVVQTALVLAHAHTLSDPGHAHGVADPGHAHSIADPGHAHGIDNSVYSGGGNHTAVGRSPADYLNNANTRGAGTGIGIYGNTTGIGIYAAGTGMSVQSTGGTENRPRNVALCPHIFY